MNSEHLTEYAGLPIVDFLTEGAEKTHLYEAFQRDRRDGVETPTSTPHRERMEKAMTAPASVAWRLHLHEGPETFSRYMDRFVREVDTSRVTALVIGSWAGWDNSDVPSDVARDALIEHVSAFPALDSVFLGDITFEECEISWLQQCDLAPLLTAYPRLSEVTVRGVGDPDRTTKTYPLSLEVPEHTGLRSLTLQSGGLPGTVVRGVVSSGLPHLEHLELWLGVKDYGGDSVPEDLAPVLSGDAFPNLRHLGLRNAQDTGLWLRALVDSPVLARLTSVDLSEGSLRGRDVDHLLASVPALAHLESLDLHHHYLSEEETERVCAAFAAAGVEVDLSEREVPDGDEPDDEYAYYPSVTE